MNEPQPIAPNGTPPRVWPSFVTLVLALLAILVSGAVLGVIVIVKGGKDASPAGLMAQPGFLVAAAALSQICLLLAVGLLPKLFSDVGVAGWGARMRWRPERLSLLDVVVCAVGTQAIGAVALAALTLLEVKGGLLASMSGAAKDTSPAQFALLLLFGAIAPGLAEELTFRGLLQTRLVERWGAVTGVVVSATLFGLWHLDVRQGLMAMMMGLWLGWCALRHQSIVNVAFAHVANNAFAFTLARFADQEPEGSAPFSTIAVGLLVTALCAAVVQRRAAGRLRNLTPPAG